MSTRGRVLITGGAGFLGSHLCDRFITEGYSVICLDNLLTGSLTNIHHLRDHPRFAFILGDVTTPIEIEGIVDFILHFASPASPKDYARHPIHTLKVGALGVYHALDLAQAKGATFLLASSSEVYGDPQVNPQPESYWGYVNPVGPRSVYDEAKRYAEAVTAAYHRVHGLDVRIARIFNAYGPRMRLDDGRALPTFITQALRGEALTVYGDGSQTRSFGYLDDIVEGIYRLALLNTNRQMLLGHGVEAGTNSKEPLIMNLGNPEEISILELAHEIIKLTGTSNKIAFEPLPIDDPKVRRPHIGCARTLMGWEPKVSRLIGLQRTIRYFRKLLSSEV